MKIGFHTNSLSWQGMTEINNIADWAISVGLQDMEIGPAVDLDVEKLEKIIDNKAIDISALIYVRNFLDENEELAQEHQKNLKKRIEAAGHLGIKKVICSTGVSGKSFYNMRFNPEKSMDQVIKLFTEFIELAEKNNVSLCLENCPMMGNIAISPYMWDKIFSTLDSDKIGLAYDPSHMVWQMMDPYEVIREFRKKIYHVHGKDTEILKSNLKRVGILHNINEETKFFEEQWWRHRLPGLGDLNWRKIINNLDEINYEGSISIEHEDPVWEGSLEKVQKGIVKSLNYLNSIIE